VICGSNLAWDRLDLLQSRAEQSRFARWSGMFWSVGEIK
jgi:hypothetical protein